LGLLALEVLRVVGKSLLVCELPILDKLALLCLSITWPSLDQPSLPKPPLLISDKDGNEEAIWPVAIHIPVGGFDS
jgi:hypothetical protein